jgi:hypothetical protein
MRIFALLRKSVMQRERETTTLKLKHYFPTCERGTPLAVMQKAIAVWMKPADFWTRQAILFLKVSPSSSTGCYEHIGERERRIRKRLKSHEEAK